MLVFSQRYGCGWFQNHLPRKCQSVQREEVNPAPIRHEAQSVKSFIPRASQLGTKERFTGTLRGSIPDFWLERQGDFELEYNQYQFCCSTLWGIAFIAFLLFLMRCQTLSGMGGM